MRRLSLAALAAFAAAATSETGFAASAPDGKDAVATLTVVEQVCLPLLAGAKIDVVAKTAGLKSGRNGWVLPIGGKRRIEIDPPGGSNPHVCAATVVHDPNAGGSIIDALAAWSAKQTPALQTLKVQEKATGALYQLTTSSWVSKVAGGNLALVYSEDKTLDGKSVAGNLDQASLTVGLDAVSVVTELMRGMLAAGLRRFDPRTQQGRRAGQLQARRAWRLGVMVAVAVAGGLVAALFAKLCDMAMEGHVQLYARAPWLTLLLLPIGFGLITWITRKMAPEAAGSGIPQVIAAAEQRWSGRWDGQRVTLRTALWKILLSAALLLCGGSIGREGPTVQVVAGLMRALSRGLRGGPGRRAVIIAGGAAGVSAAFNTPIAGVVFAVEELARGFERRTNSFVILVVVVAGFTSYALQGDYAYFGVLQGDPALAGAWLSAPLIGVSGGLLGGFFSRGLALVIGPVDNPVTRWRAGRPVVFAVLCGVLAAAVALASGGLTFGAGYAEAKNLLNHDQGGGIGFAIAKLVASFAAACSGAPGGIFAPSLATGAGLGAAFAHLGLVHSGRNAVVLGMAGYLSGVVQAPLTSAVILMEMTREPSLVGPLMLTALVARWTAGLLMPEPLYHVLSRSWLPPIPGDAQSAAEPSEAQQALTNVNPMA